MILCVCVRCIEIHDLWRVLVVCVCLYSDAHSQFHMNVKSSKLKSVRVHGQKVNRNVFSRRTWKRRATQSIVRMSWRSVFVAQDACPRELLFFHANIVMMQTLRINIANDTDIDWLRNFRLMRLDNTEYESIVCVCRCAHVKSWSDWLILFLCVCVLLYVAIERATRRVGVRVTVGKTIWAKFIGVTISNRSHLFYKNRHLFVSILFFHSSKILSPRYTFIYTMWKMKGWKRDAFIHFSANKGTFLFRRCVYDVFAYGKYEKSDSKLSTVKIQSFKLYQIYIFDPWR